MSYYYKTGKELVNIKCFSVTNGSKKEFDLDVNVYPYEIDGLRERINEIYNQKTVYFTIKQIKC